jgi:hypothetical protein
VGDALLYVVVIASESDSREAQPIAGSADAAVMTILPARRSYDHRNREMICETGDPDLFPELKIPRPTIRRWLHRVIPDVVT